MGDRALRLLRRRVRICSLFLHECATRERTDGRACVSRSRNALDLSKAVFEKLTADTGGLDRGVVPLIWGFTGNVSSTEPPKTTAGKGGQTKEDGDADDKDKDHNAKEEGEESDKGWFDGWFGSSDESDHVSE